MKKVSVIIPIYNTENYLERCVNSVLTQTHNNLEIILINDGSTDNSLDICKKLADKDKRIILIDKENTGVSNTRNIGIEKSSGNYIIFIDSDDLIDKNYISLMLEKMETNNVNVVVSGITFCDELLNFIKEQLYPVNNKILKFKDIKEDIITTGYFNSVCKALYKKEIFKDLRFNEQLKYGEDLLFSFSILYNNDIYYIKNCGYFYVQNQNSLTHSTNLKATSKYIDDNIYVYNKLANYYQDKTIINQILLTKYNNAFKKLITIPNIKYKKFKKYIISTFKNNNQPKITLSKINKQSKLDNILLYLLNNKNYLLYYLTNKITYYIKKLKIK